MSATHARRSRNTGHLCTARRTTRRMVVRLLPPHYRCLSVPFEREFCQFLAMMALISLDSLDSPFGEQQLHWGEHQDRCPWAHLKEKINSGVWQFFLKVTLLPLPTTPPYNSFLFTIPWGSSTYMGEQHHRCLSAPPRKGFYHHYTMVDLRPYSPSPVLDSPFSEQQLQRRAAVAPERSRNCSGA